ncbi:hypothetical protein Pla108_22730 [Botrimarina colliarenosi]|uniref:Uncharacterized protein n=1 Tax=Botrimarina colliarenosi TaxID=2528001 RepID=A0A5C6AFB4_9BACT|nr:hypothetical protein [Botrimarina colliarenosi]TWT98116.1 hypothetical protein Pla108_22730 [Botrimarina colliarenosi]
MLKRLLKRWADWTGDKRLTDTIRAELRRLGYAVNAAQVRRVHLAAVERPGWVQIYCFTVETRTNEENPHTRRDVVLHGVSRDDGRKSRTEMLLTEDEACWRQQLDSWSDGLILRPQRR